MAALPSVSFQHGTVGESLGHRIRSGFQRSSFLIPPSILRGKFWSPHCGHTPSASQTSPSHLRASAGAMMTDAATSTVPEQGSAARRVVKVSAIPVTPEAFSPFGTVVSPVDDGGVYGPEDAQLDLSRGIPRVYIMRLRDRKLGFDNITHHASVTQCLGAAGNGTWYLAVCQASVVDPPSTDGEAPSGSVKSQAGHWYFPPRPEDIVVFKLQGPCILKLHAGTWHAGPLFTDSFMDFFNLELADTNVVDHTTHYFGKEDNLEFAFDP